MEFIYHFASGEHGKRKCLPELRSADKRRYITQMRITGKIACGVSSLIVNERRDVVANFDVLRAPEGIKFRLPIWDDDVGVEVTGAPVTVFLTMEDE